MKQFCLILAIVFCGNTFCSAQSNDISIGVVVSYHEESRKRTLDTNGDEKHSSIDFFGAGIKLQKKFADSWRFSTGLNYVKRHYRMTVFYDHCYFSEGDCELDLRSAHSYGYRTIEIPLGISKYLSAGDIWGFYTNLNIMTAIDFQSYYTGGGKISSTNELHFFSCSLTHNFGLTRNIMERFQLTFEPFIRLVNVQRDDPILILSTERKWTFFNNFGAHLLLLYSL